MLNKGTASLEVKNSERNRELENFASLEPRVCEVLLYYLSSYVRFSELSLKQNTVKTHNVKNTEDAIDQLKDLQLRNVKRL